MAGGRKGDGIHLIGPAETAVRLSYNPILRKPVAQESGDILYFMLMNVARGMTPGKYKGQPKQE